MRDDGEVGRSLRRTALAVALLVAVALGGTGCGTASPRTAPTGIDLLQVPTPSPDPADFVSTVDNPWLPYARGATWTYEASGAVDGTVTVTVRQSEETVAGVVTTTVERTDPTGTQVVDLFAQDRAGNVWWFGREGEWLAGEDGAQAGLAMPASPRRGDGWRAAYAAGRLDVRATVVATDESVSTPGGRFTGLVSIEVSGAPPTGSAPRSYYARGVGLVAEVSTEGPATLLELVRAPG